MAIQKSTVEVAGEEMQIRWRDWTSFAVEVEWVEPDGTYYIIESLIHPNLERDHPDDKPCDTRNDITIEIIREAVENVLEEHGEDPELERFKVIEKTEIRAGRPAQ